MTPSPENPAVGARLRERTADLVTDVAIVPEPLPRISDDELKRRVRTLRKRVSEAGARVEKLEGDVARAIAAWSAAGTSGVSANGARHG